MYHGGMPGASIPLSELGAELTSCQWAPGFTTKMLVFECPNQRCAQGHSQGIPFSDAPFHDLPDPRSVPGGVQRKIKLWQRVSGDSIDNITLSPSFVVQSCDGLHGHVVNGQWVPC